MTNISFSTGTYKEYQLNGKETIRVNVSDPGIIDRIQGSITKIDELKTKYSELTTDNVGKLDREIRTMIDDVLACPGAADKAFGDISCLTIADGKPIFMSFLSALLEQLKKDITSTLEAQKVQLSSLDNERTHKYIKPITKPITVTPASQTVPLSALSQEERERLLREMMAE